MSYQVQITLIPSVSRTDVFAGGFCSWLVFQRVSAEKDLSQFPLAENSSQFGEPHERDKHHEQEQCESKNSLPGATAELLTTLIE